MSAALLDIHIRHKAFGNSLVLQQLQAQIAAGEIIALLGASGSGKSTLLHIASGLDQADAPPSQLSAAQAQRVALARALFKQPPLLLADEPFAALDDVSRLRLQDLLQTVAQRHQTALLLATHDIHEATCLADRLWVLDSHTGRLAADLALPLPRPRQRGSAALAEQRAWVREALLAGHAV